MGYPLPSQVKAGVIFGPANEFIGTGETVFASMFSVQIEQVEQVVSTRHERPAIYSPPALREVVSISAPVTSEISDQQKSITVFQTTPSTFVYASQEVIIVSETVRQAWVKTEFGSGVTVYLQPVNRGTIGI